MRPGVTPAARQVRRGGTPLPRQPLPSPAPDTSGRPRLLSARARRSCRRPLVVLSQDPPQPHPLPCTPPLIGSGPEDEEDVIGVEGVDVGIELPPKATVTVRCSPRGRIPEIVHPEKGEQFGGGHKPSSPVPMV